MKKKNNNTGITLIALVVTIIILIILAVISINLLFNEDGIIKRAMNMQYIQKMAEEKERIELAKVAVAMDNKGKIPADEYVEELIKEGITTEKNVKYNEDGSIQIITNSDRNLKIETDEVGNVIEITEGEEENTLTVSIDNVQLTAKTHSIKIKIEVARAEGAIYKYYYKDVTGTYIQAYQGEKTSYTIERLDDGIEYWIRVEATNDYGMVSKEVLGKTKAIVSGQESATDLQKIGEYEDEFAMIELDATIENLGSISVDSFIEAVKKDGVISEENMTINSDGNFEMITKERYVFEVVLKSANDIEVDYIGIAEN